MATEKIAYNQTRTSLRGGRWSLTQDITYTAFNKVSQITENDKVLDLTYGPDDERVYTKLTDNASGNTQILYEKYFAPNFEHYADAVQTVGGKDVHYVQSPFGLAAVIVKENTNPYEINFIGTDYLGSITHVMDGGGVEIQKCSYDAWGRRRNPADWKVYDEGNPAPALLKFARGYTGHEHLEDFGLINMNGRMYDAAMAKMLSPDNINNAPFSTIGLNRYAYVGNNPLKNIDPSGHAWWHYAIADVLTAGTVTATLTTFAASTAIPVSTMAQTALVTAASIYTNPGSAYAFSFIAGTRDGGFAEGMRRGQNSYDIWAGLFQYDHDENRKGRDWHNFLTVGSRLSWEAPQTLSGLIITQGANTVGEIDDVQYFHGATLAYGLPADGSGFTLGSYINLNTSDGESNLIIGPGGYTTMHEYGHYLQSRKNGPMYLFKHGAQSALGNADWTEKDANLRAANYFERVDANFTWQEDYYLNIDLERYSLFPTNGKYTNAKWWEYLFPFTFTGP